MIDPVLQYWLAGVFALLFACTGVEKMRQLDVVSEQISEYAILPSLLAPVAARLVALLEITTATLLITQYYVIGAQLGILMLLIYATAIGVNLTRGRITIDCGCQLQSSNGISWFLVTRNIAMAGLLTIVVLPGLSRELLWLDFVVIAFGLASATLVYVCTNLLITHYHNQRNWWAS